MRNLSHFLIVLSTILFFFAISASAAPTTFAEVEKSWQRGLSEKDIHTDINQHPTPSYHPLIPKDTVDDDEAHNHGFTGMLDERTMAVREKSLHNILRKKNVFGRVFGQKKEKIEEQGNEAEVLRPVRNRRSQV